MLRELDKDELRLCIEGGQSFFAEGEMPGGFDAEYFCSHWGRLIEAGRAMIVGSFDGEYNICGALGAVVGPGMFSPITMAVEGFWYVLPEHRDGKHGLQLLSWFEGWAKRKGAGYAAMIHLMKLQPERLGDLYERRGYALVEKHYVKAL